ncbi:MAG: bifunctional 5,10-methylenetetrahydrofolate dehydrogenase/5,10-methenyltetrahydrofolate cyclohydrolase [Patescibacteria group bacterium]
MATILDGTIIAEHMHERIRMRVDALGVAPMLAAVSVGKDPAVEKFIAIKKKAAERCGINFSSYVIEDASDAKLREAIAFLNADDETTGIFLELPLPHGMDADLYMNLIDPGKDVDVLTAQRLATFHADPAGLVLLPPTVRALREVCELRGMALHGMQCAVVGGGQLVGDPIARWLQAQGAIVALIDEHTKDPAAIASRANLIVSGVGKPKLITKKWIKEGATVIDFGYALHKGKVTGDVDVKSVAPLAGLLTPVPGGMGPIMVVAMLENLCEL